MSRFFFDGNIRRNGGTRYSKRSVKSTGADPTPPPPPRDYYDLPYRNRSHSGGSYDANQTKLRDDDLDDFENRRRYVSSLLERYYSHPSNRCRSMPSSLRKQLADALASGKNGDGRRKSRDVPHGGGYEDDSVSEISSFAVRSARTTPEPSFYEEDDARSSTVNGDGEGGRKKRKSRFFRSSSIRSLKKLVSKLRGGGRESDRPRAPRSTTDPGFLNAVLAPSQDSGLETPSDSSVNYNANNLRVRGHFPNKDNAISRATQANGRIPTPALCGIENHGNTCYINAVIQCLSNTDLLAEYFLTGRYSVDLSNNLRNADRYGSHGNVTMALADFFNALWFNTYRPDVSSAFKRVVEHYSEQYRGNQQQDAQEFFYWLSDRVHEDLNVAVKRRYKLRRSRGKNEDELAAAAMEKHLEAHNSFISARFHGLFLSSITCPACYKQSTKPDPFMCISLPVSQSSKRPLFVVVVFLSRQPRRVRFGLNADVTATFREVKTCLGDATGLNTECIVLCEMNSRGLRSTLVDQNQVVTLSTKCLWAFETPATSGASGTEELVLLVGSQLSGHSSGQQSFGTVSSFKVHREVSYGDLCRSILLSLRPQLKQNLSIQDIPLNSFRMRVVDDYRPMVYIPQDVALPLYTQAVDNALANTSSGTQALHLKVMLEWKREAKESYFSSNEERIYDHISAQDLRDQEEHPEVQSLRDCLADYTRPEACQWYCPSCRRRQDEAVKRIVLYWLPDVLVFHLKRFKQQSNGQLVKLDSPVWFPVTDLDLSDFTYQSICQSRRNSKSRPPSISSYRAPGGELYIDMTHNQNVYDLYAICNHSGSSPHSGHYTAYCRNPVNGKWYCFDDHSVTAMHERDLVTNSAYLLFYERRQMRKGATGQHSSTESGFVDHWYFQLYAQCSRRNSYSSKDTLDGLDSNGSSTGSQRKSTACGQDGLVTSSPPQAVAQNKLYVKLPEKGQHKSVDMENGDKDKAPRRARDDPSGDAAGDHSAACTRGQLIAAPSTHFDAGHRIPQDCEASSEPEGHSRASASQFNSDDVLLPSCAKLLTTGIVPPLLSTMSSAEHPLPVRHARTCSAVETDL